MVVIRDDDDDDDHDGDDFTVLTNRYIPQG